MKLLQIHISGKVQGVWFRKYTKDKADELGIKGFVQNLADGSVYAEAEGNEEQLAAFVSWCHVGSPKSQVEQVLVKEGVIKDYKEFSIN